MSKCIILSRVSSNIQTLDSQTEAIKKQAVKEGYSPDDMLIIEDKESAIKLSEEERHGLNEMKRMINEDPEIDHIFIYELSRLSRRQLVLFSIRDFLIERGIQLTCCTPYFQMLENGKLSQTANLMFSIFASMAESEMELKKERMLRGRQYNRLTGKISEGRPTPGYRVREDKTLEIDPEKKDFIVDMFTLYATGQYSILTLTKELLMRHPQDGMTVTKLRPTVSWLLRYDRFCGDSQYPQIISRELFDKCREVAKSNTSNNKHFEKCDALLKRIIYSKKSGHHMTYKAIPCGHRYEAPYEKPMLACLIKNIDEHVWQLSQQLHKTYIMTQDETKKKLEAKADTIIKKMMNLQVMTKKLRDKTDLIEERLIYGKLSKDKANKMTAEIESQINQYENEKAKLNEDLMMTQKLIDDNTFKTPPDYNKFIYEQKVELVHTVIKRVELEKTTYRDFRAWVTTNVDDFMYIIDFNNYTGSFSLTSKAMFVKP